MNWWCFSYGATAATSTSSPPKHNFNINIFIMYKRILCSARPAPPPGILLQCFYRLHYKVFFFCICCCIKAVVYSGSVATALDLVVPPRYNDNKDYCILFYCNAKMLSVKPELQVDTRYFRPQKKTRWLSEKGFSNTEDKGGQNKEIWVSVCAARGCHEKKINL